MEETVVLKLKTYNDLKQQIAFLEEGMMGAINGAIEAHEELEKKKNAYKPIIREYVQIYSYSDLSGIYSSKKDELEKSGLFEEFDAIRIEMMNEKIAEQEASVDAEMELNK